MSKLQSDLSEDPLGLSEWRSRGFDPLVQGGNVIASLPPLTIAIGGASSQTREVLTSFLKERSVAPSMILSTSDGHLMLYRADHDAAIERIRASLSGHATVLGPGEEIMLPSLADCSINVDHISACSILPAEVPQETAQSAAPVPLQRTPFLPHSLRGQAAAFEAEVQPTSPLLGEVCLYGQATVWYAPPNAGKTLITLSLLHDAVRARRVEPGNVYYINADDNHAGLTTKLRLTDDLGVHTLAPGHMGYKAADLLPHLESMASEGKARGVFVIIDTLKKFTSLMDKRESSTFANACRQFVMRGGTVLGLAHTTKNPGVDGKQRYAGTTDILEDFDAAYLISALTQNGAAGEKVVAFQAIKKRGDSADTAAYAYAAERGITYEERLASVHAIDPDALEEFQRIETAAADSVLIDAARTAIGAGTVTKMDLVAAIAADAKTSRRAAIKVVERYTGNDPVHHRWQMAVGARGAKIFELLAEPPA